MIETTQYGSEFVEVANLVLSATVLIVIIDKNTHSQLILLIRHFLLKSSHTKELKT